MLIVGEVRYSEIRYNDDHYYITLDIRMHAQMKPRAEDVMEVDGITFESGPQGSNQG